MLKIYFGALVILLAFFVKRLNAQQAEAALIVNNILVNPSNISVCDIQI
jgi:hypothetical protein